MARPGVVAVTAGPSCGARLIKNDEQGLAIRILFAKNGAVQRYEIARGRDNTESVNDMLLGLEHQFGPAAIDAPPLKIVSFKKSDGGGGMMIPDKAVDSCGRTLSFN